MAQVTLLALVLMPGADKLMRLVRSAATPSVAPANAAALTGKLGLLKLKVEQLAMGAAALSVILLGLP